MEVKVLDILEIRNFKYDSSCERVFRFLDENNDEWWAIGYGGDYYCASEEEICEIESSSERVTSIDFLIHRDDLLGSYVTVKETSHYLNQE